MSQKILFEKLSSDGKAIGYWHDKAVFVVGPLPGETADVVITREKKSWAEASMRAITQPSAHRVGTTENHYLSCSPWQGVEYKYQCELKSKMLAEVCSQPLLALEVKTFHGAEMTSGYRNKLEFSVYNFDGEFGLAFHERGRFDSFLSAPDGCVLGSDAMNAAAKAVAAKLVARELDPHTETITVRESKSNGALIAVITVSPQSDKLPWAILGAIDGIQGLRVVKKVKHNIYKTLHLAGDTDLEEVVGGVTVKYPWDSFFQVNLPMFELVLADIRTNIPADARVLDLYCGAGSIGLALAKDGHNVAGVEIIEASVNLANANASIAGLDNYHATCAPAEKLSLVSFEGIDVVIVDPPRAGLHPDVIQMLKDALPERIIYVSCNPITQARDLILLQDIYDLSPVIGYDQYPGTLHLESLIVLDRKSV